MLKDNMTISPEEANRIIRDLDQIGADLLSILAMRGDIAMGRLNTKKGDAVLCFAERAAGMADRLATQFATLRVAEAVAKAPPKEAKATKAPRQWRNYAPKEAQIIGLPMHVSGSFASMLLQPH